MSHYGFLRKIRNKSALSKLLIDWCTREKSRLPETISEVQEEFRSWNIDAEISDQGNNGETRVTIIQTALNEWIVSLPPIEAIESALDKIRSTGQYPVDQLPSYFTAYPRNGQVYDEDFFYARLADFTVTQC